MAASGPFSTENKVFEQHRKEWLLSHPGEFVAIQDDVILEGFLARMPKHSRLVCTRFGIRRRFLVKQVWVTEPVYCVS